MASAETVYERNVKPLPPMERLRLVRMILEELTRDKDATIDPGTSWSEQDLADLTAFSLRHAARQ